MSKKIITALLIVLTLAPFSLTATAQAAQPVNVYFFWGDGCPHCAKEKVFLDQLKTEYPGINIFDYEVWKNSDNRELLIKVGNKLDAEMSGVPVTIIGEKYFIGWYNEEVTGSEIRKAIDDSLANGCRDVVNETLTANQKENQTNQNCEDQNPTIPEKISLPILGEIETKNFSLPVLTIIIGALDGFNPCAMWVLLFLISLLLGMKDKRRMWVLGSAFIIASASVYFLFMAAWLNLLLFIGFVFWIRIVIGLVAAGAGGYNLKEYWTNKDATCKVTGQEKRKKIFDNLKKIAQEKKFWLALGGIIILAFAVNLVELICSAGFPAIYTQILSLGNLAQWQYYLYLALYIFIFMLDDLIVFFIAMTTLQVTGITTKYTRASHLIGGILMLIIGLLLILKPELLMFG